MLQGTSPEENGRGGDGGAAAGGTAARVLVAVGSDRVRAEVRGSLAGRGFEVVATADGGEEAVIAYKKLDGAVDVVVLDVALRDPDGYGTLAAIRAHDPVARVVMIGGDADEESALKARAIGAEVYLPRPLDPQVLADALR